MPLTVHGDRPAKLILDADLAKEKPRTLLIKFLSKKEVRVWQKRFDDCSRIDAIDTRDAAYDALLGEVVTGWENIAGDFSIAAISEHYTLPEFMELMRSIPHAMVPGADDLKKSVSA